MGRFDKYLLSQLVVLFGFFSLVLVLVYWINRAVLLLDRLIADGQSAAVFMELTLLSLPRIMENVLPIAAFASAVYVTNRLSNESELVVVQATGFSPFRLARPVLLFGLLSALMIGALTHFMVPLAIRQLNIRQAEISSDVTARLLTEGTFVHPADGITFYVREISPAGELNDIFLSDSRSDKTRTNYLARRALIVRGDEGPLLLMFDGMAQVLTLETKRLAITRFDDFAYDIGGLIGGAATPSQRASDLTTPHLLWPSPQELSETGATPTEMLATAHERTTHALLALVTALVGFASLIVGGFSRFGLWKQILGGIAFLIILKTVDNAAITFVRGAPVHWWLLYMPSIGGLLVGYGLLWRAAHPRLFRRKAPAGRTGAPS